MNQDDIRSYLGAHPAVRIQIAADGDGSPEIAWGDTFFTVVGADGEPRKMPFATLVIKDYPGFDSESQLDRGGLFRLNLDLGKTRFEALFGFAPKDLEPHRGEFDFSATNRLFPHPVYGAHGWASIINPESAQQDRVQALLDEALNRALQKTGV